MLTKIKSVLAGITPALPAASPSQGPSSPASTPDVVKAQVHLKKPSSAEGRPRLRWYGSPPTWPPHKER